MATVRVLVLKSSVVVNIVWVSVVIFMDPCVLSLAVGVLAVWSLLLGVIILRIRSGEMDCGLSLRPVVGLLISGDSSEEIGGVAGLCSEEIGAVAGLCSEEIVGVAGLCSEEIGAVAGLCSEEIGAVAGLCSEAVSYTHLTLPTILSV